MPYKVKGQCVYKKDTGNKVGCTKGPVKDYLAALHANANESITEENVLKGGKADKLSIQDIADKFGVSVSKIKHELEMGKKVEHEHTKNMAKATEIAMDHLSEFPDYYTRLAKMEKEAEKHTKKLKVNEDTKGLIKRLIRENIGVVEEKLENPTVTFHIKDGGDNVATVVVGDTNKTFGPDTMEILYIYFNAGVNNLEIGKKTLIELFECYPNINRFVIQPNPESRDFWYKLDAQRINDKYMIIFRAH